MGTEGTPTWDLRERQTGLWGHTLPSSPPSRPWRIYRPQPCFQGNLGPTSSFIPILSAQPPPWPGARSLSGCWWEHQKSNTDTLSLPLMILHPAISLHLIFWTQQSYDSGLTPSLGFSHHRSSRAWLTQNIRGLLLLCLFLCLLLLQGTEPRLQARS